MAHPHIDHYEELYQPVVPAAAMGYRMPAEWEPLACVWLTRPHNEETWPGCLDKAQEQFDAWVEAMRPHVPVSMTEPMGIKTNDSWIRDYGPIFVVRDSSLPADWPSSQVDQAGEVTEWSHAHLDEGSRPSPLACHDFHFNGWGGKYELRDLDDTVPQHIARMLGIPLWVHDFILEGGSIEVNGKGTVLTTEQCLLNPNRNPGMSREDIENQLYETLGVKHTIWLPGGIVGDDTDGHIDDIARFVSSSRVVAVRAEKDHPDYEVLNKNLKALQNARDQDGKQLTVVELPSPDPMEYDYPADRFGPGGKSPLPASYANFLICNGAVFVPVFGQARDDEAIRVMEEVLPAHAIIPIRAEWMVVGLGSLHCLSQQQPAAGIGETLRKLDE